MEAQLEIPGIAFSRTYVEDIQIHWNEDTEHGYESANYLGRYIHSAHVGHSYAVIQREEQNMLGEEQGIDGITERWLKYQGKKLWRLKQFLHRYHNEVGSKPGDGSIHCLNDLSTQTIFLLFSGEICDHCGFYVDGETGRRILAGRTYDADVGRDCAEWFDPSENYDLKTGKDWDREGACVPNKDEIKSFNDVSNWPPKGSDGKRKGKAFNGWKRYGIRPDLSYKRPGFWVNVFYACQDHERLEKMEEGEWHMMAINATAVVVKITKIGDTEPPLCEREEIESGWLCGIESDSDRDYFLELEEEKIEELKSIAAEHEARWPKDPEIANEGDVPY